MKSLTMVVLFVILSFTCALAHNGAISLYLDENINDCDEDSAPFAIVDINLYYVRDHGPDLGEAYEFRLICSSANVQFNAPTWPATMQAIQGTLENGIAVTHNSCIGTGLDVTWLGTVPVFNVGEEGEFTVQVVDHPTSMCPGPPPFQCPGIWITLCPDPKPKYQCLGGTFIFNGQCNPGVDAKSWGAIKALYK